MPTLSRPPRRLLAPRGADVAAVDLDLLLRYDAVAEHLDALLTVAPGPVRVLEVGCHGHDLLRRLLDPGLVQVTRCDITAAGDDPDFFVIPSTPPWPVADAAYDAVVALEVLEHLPARQRREFLAECLRVARHGAVFTCPNGAPEVVAAEARVAAELERRSGTPHQFLREHQQHGLPTEGEITEHLDALGVEYTVFDQMPVDVWEPALLLGEELRRRQAPPEAQARLNRLFFDQQLHGSGVPYRKLYVVGAASRAAPEQSRALQVRLGSPDLPNDPLLTIAADALIALSANDDQRLQAIRAEHRADLAVMQRYLSSWLQRYVVFNSFVKSLYGSRLWRLLAPLRALRRWLRPRGFDAAALVPWQNLEAKEPGVWRVTGTDAHFIVPCTLDAGYLRVQLQMTADVPGQVALYSDNATGAMDMELLARWPVNGRACIDEFVQLPKPALALRIDPLGVPGTVRLESLRVTPVSSFKSWASGGRKSPGESINTGGKTSPARPEIVYVLKTAGLCGGVRVVLEHVSRLHQRGHNVCLYFVDGDVGWFGRDVPHRSFGTVAALKQALRETRGIKVATWHETAPWVADSLQPGDRGYYLVQDIEESYCTRPEEVEHVLATYRLGLRPIAEGQWVADQLRTRFGLDPVFVSIGLDHEVFQPREARRDPHLILTQARTCSGGGAAGARLKGWETARAVVQRCHAAQPETSLLTYGLEEQHPVPTSVPHVHVKGPSDAELARLYGRAGLFLLTSTHEGFGLTAAEAMACGCPVVATRAHGNEEFCIDGVTALLAPAGDVEELARQCLRLQADPGLAAELAKHGQELIRSYTWERVVDRLEAEFAGKQVLRTSPPHPSPPPQGGREPELAGASEHFASEQGGGREPELAGASEYPDLELGDATTDWTVVIPTVHDVERVVRCVSTCRQHGPNDGRVQVIVVDDGSSADIRRQLQTAADDLDFELLCNHQNLGFSAAVNRGLRNAAGRFVLLCNNDVEFLQPWAAPLERTFADPDVGIIGGRLLYPDGTLQHAGMTKVPGQLLWVHTLGRQPGSHPDAQHNRDVWAVTGALLAVRRDVLRQLGGLSTAYATAYEDVDYCLHAWRHGVRVRYCADLCARHSEGGTRGASSAEKTARPLFWTERERAGRAYFEKKWADLRHVDRFEMLSSTRENTPSLALPHPGGGNKAVAPLVAR